MAMFGELYEKILSDDGEKKALAQALATKEGTAAFLAERGCEATPEEFVAFLKEKAPKPAGGELDDAELEGAAGGAWYDTLGYVCYSIIFVIICWLDE